MEKESAPKIKYVIEDNVLLCIEVDKNIFLRIIQADDLYMDIRKFYKGFPTKQGVRFKMSMYNMIKEKINEFSK